MCGVSPCVLLQVEKVRGELTSQERKKLNTSIIIDVHARDIVDRFVRDSVLDAREFDWESQLRFYWRADVDDCRIEQCTGVFGYGFEYMVQLEFLGLLFFPLWGLAGWSVCC
mgnify:FL=1